MHTSILCITVLYKRSRLNSYGNILKKKNDKISCIVNYYFICINLPLIFVQVFKFP